MVAPFTGAWIEIRICLQGPGGRRSSHPSRVRGLKFILPNHIIQCTHGSHPSRVRGLKCMHYKILKIKYCVAPFMGAWIEMWIALCI